MYFRIGSRISVTFKIKFYLRTVNKFSAEFHVKHGIKPELNLVAWSTKILKDIKEKKNPYKKFQKLFWKPKHLKSIFFNHKIIF